MEFDRGLFVCSYRHTRLADADRRYSELKERTS